MYNYTIIIPHKNIPDLLQRCLDSIPVRDDVQVIVVDDNSDVDKVDFVHFPGRERTGIELVFSKGKNGKGPGFARNVGLSKAIGKWVVFADSDDYFTDEFPDLLEKYKQSEKDVIFFKCLRQDEYGTVKEYPLINEPINEAIITGNTDGIVYGVPCPWGKFIKRDFLEKNNIRYQEITGGDDILFSIQIAVKLSNMLIADDSLYCVVDRPGSLTRNTHWKNFYSYSLACIDAYGLLKTVSKENLAVGWLISWWGFLWAENIVLAMSLTPKILTKLRSKDALHVIKKGIKTGSWNWRTNL